MRAADHAAPKLFNDSLDKITFKSHVSVNVSISCVSSWSLSSRLSGVSRVVSAGWCQQGVYYYLVLVVMAMDSVGGVWCQQILCSLYYTEL